MILCSQKRIYLFIEELVTKCRFLLVFKSIGLTQYLHRSRSEEALTEITAELHEASYKGLRVMDHPTSMYNLHQPIEDEDDGTTVLYDSPKPTPPSDLTEQSDSRSNRISTEERLPNAEEPSREAVNSHEAQNSNQEPQGSLDLMQDSSDSEGEDDDQIPSESTFYTRYTIDGSNELQQEVGKLTLNHPYYANTGAIPKNSSSSIPPSAPTIGQQQFAQGKEVVKVDVHAPIGGGDLALQQQRWTSYNRYDPRNNRHYLYDVQEMEPHYGDVAPATGNECRVRDSGCSDGSSQAEIMDHTESQKPGDEYPSNLDGEHNASSSAQRTYASNIYTQKQHYSSSSEQLQGSNSSLSQNISRSSSKEFSEPHQQIQQQQHLNVQQQKQQHMMQQQLPQYSQQQTQQHYGPEADNPQHFAPGTEAEAATYLDMDRCVEVCCRSSICSLLDG